MESADEFISRKNEEFERDQRKNKLIKTKDIARNGWNYWTRRAWTLMRQSDHREKVFVLERWEWVRQEGTVPISRTVGKVEYRLGYFIVAKNGRSAGHWVWGQFCPLIPAEDVSRLLGLATKQGTLVNTSVANLGST
jgi:hypothetical protein